MLGEGKSLEHLIGLLEGLHARGRGALVSRPTRAHLAALRRAQKSGLPISFEAGDRIARLAGPIADGYRPGTVAVVTAGTADIPTAEEAVSVLRAVGVRVVTSYDVGVAGIHRLSARCALERAPPGRLSGLRGSGGRPPDGRRGARPGARRRRADVGRVRARGAGRGGAPRNAPVLRPGRGRQHRCRGAGGVVRRTALRSGFAPHPRTLPSCTEAMTGPVPQPPPWPPLPARAAGAEGIYRGNPDRFTGPPSRFYHWAFARLTSQFARGQVLELGCGTGRDARGFAATGFQVTAVDYSVTAIERARQEIDNPPTIRFRRTDALTALQETLTASLEAVYVHAVYMMLPDGELAAVFREVRRVSTRGDSTSSRSGP